MIPTRPEERDLILLSHRWWREQMLPVKPDDENGALVDLVYLMPGEPDFGIERAIRESFVRHRLGEWFGRVEIRFAGLAPERNHYVREAGACPPNEFGLKSGPNHLFFFMIQEVSPEYDCVLQMETDCIPIRAGWLKRFIEVQARHPEGWVIGSPYLGPRLPRPWTNHLNGNAIYRTGSESFQNFVANFWKQRIDWSVKYIRPEMAFDCVWEEFRQTAHHLPGPIGETVARFDSRFQPDRFVANMAPGLDYPRTTPELERLRSDLPETHIVHGSWLLPQVRSILGVEPEVRTRSVAKPRGQKPDSADWVWIKEFFISETAWLDRGEGSLPKADDYIAWKLDSVRLPRLEIEVHSTEGLEVSLSAAHRSRLAPWKRLLHRLEAIPFPGRHSYFALKRHLRDLPFSARHRPGVSGAKLATWNLDRGSHQIRLDLPSPNLPQDVRLTLRNSGSEPVAFTLRFVMGQVAPGEENRLCA